MKWQKGELFIVTGLYLLIIPFFNALNATGFENAQIQGHFGASGTEFMYMNLVPFFVLVAGIPLALELAKRFPLRSMMISVIILSFLFNTLSAWAPGIGWFIIFRSMVSFLMIFGIVAALIPIVKRYNPALNMAILYGIVQFIIQGSSHLYKFLGAHFAHIYDWRTSILMVNINFLLCIVLTFVFLRKNVSPPKRPFDFDFRGWIIMIMFFLPLLFLTAEGQRREWFSDPTVIIAIITAIIIIIIYGLYARAVSKPLIDLKVFTYRNVAIGTLLFFLTGAMNGTGSIITGFMGSILGFDDLYMARTHLFILAGLSASIPLCTYLLYKHIHLHLIAVTGFLSFALYHGLMYFRFYPEISPKDFMWPLLFKGAGIGFLYVLSSLYISEKVPKALSTSRMMSGVIARIIIASMLGATVLTTMVSKLTVQHATGIGQQITGTNEEAVKDYENALSYYMNKGLKVTEAEKLADDPLRYEIQRPAMMLAYKDIYLVMTIVSLIPALLIVMFRLGRRALRPVEVEPIPL
ncbi:MAG: MFS transporter [Bacteroidales bacterium]|nr:MFS transporter [Bacteroidales bacterium]